jgi:mono/diheme cytochrome c family protein
MIRALGALLALLAASPPPSAPKSPPPSAPELPANAPEMAILARCMVCHGMEHVTQQRLTPAQWEKTLAKMQKWGMQLTPEEAKRVVDFLSARFTPDAPERVAPRVPTPAEALPPKK